MRRSESNTMPMRKRSKDNTRPIRRRSKGRSWTVKKRSEHNVGPMRRGGVGAMPGQYGGEVRAEVGQ